MHNHRGTSTSTHSLVGAVDVEVGVVHSGAIAHVPIGVRYVDGRPVATVHHFGTELRPTKILNREHHVKKGSFRLYPN